MEKSQFRPLGGARSKEKWRIRKERPRFAIDICCPFYAILLGFRVINVFRLTWEIPISGPNFWVFPTQWPQKWLTINQTPKRHILGPEHAFWAIGRDSATSVATCKLDDEYKKGELFWMSTSPTWAAAPTRPPVTIFRFWGDIHDVITW